MYAWCCTLLEFSGWMENVYIRLFLAFAILITKQHTFLITSFLRVSLIALSLLLVFILTGFTWCVGWFLISYRLPFLHLFWPFTRLKEIHWMFLYV